jgi:uncharacterized protein
VESLELGGRVILRDGSRCAYFIPAEMRLFSLEAPADLPLPELAALAARKYTSDLAVKPHDFRFGDAQREAIFPILNEGEPRAKSGHKPRLGRLTLNISNLCNLACSYCYADQGRYHGPENLMSMVQMEEALRRILELYGEIEVVHFFGGEPLMNLPAIDAAGIYLQGAVSDGLLPRMPRLVVTTNGTWSNPAVIDTLAHWNISLTVSWDGSREIHDRCRPMLSGGSSYELLADSLTRFRENGIDFEVECTYNGYHRLNGISITDLMEFFFEQTGRKILHIAPAFLPRPDARDLISKGNYLDLASLAEDYRTAARVSIANLQKGEGPILQFAYRVAEHIATRIPAQAYCPAFFSQITVATDGTVYPCFMFAGDARYSMGNLFEGSFPNSNAATVLRRYFEEFSARPHAWYNCLSEGCVAGEAIVAGNMSEPVMAPIQQAIAEECVLQLAVPAASVESQSSGAV